MEPFERLGQVQLMFKNLSSLFNQLTWTAGDQVMFANLIRHPFFKVSLQAIGGK